jgi:hypothetical protein
MSRQRLPSNSYFQNAVADFSTNLAALPLLPDTPSVVASTPSATAGTPSPRSLSPLTPPSGTLKVVIGSDPITQRAWLLPRALLAKHSTYFAKICAKSETNEHNLEDVDPRAFANFVDYIRSSIYSLNANTAAFRHVRANVKAALLGIKFGARDYADAAIRQLYMLFEPLARLRTSNKSKSVIRASDIEFVCRQSFGSKEEEKAAERLRQLFFDATASHWGQFEAVKIFQMRDLHGDTVAWNEVNSKYPQFAHTMKQSILVMDKARAQLLRPVKEYLTPPPAVAAVVKRRGTGGSGAGAVGDRGRPILKPKSRMPSLMRMKSKRRQSGETDLGAVGAWAAGVRRDANEEDSQEAVDTEDEGWELVDEPL